MKTIWNSSKKGISKLQGGAVTMQIISRTRSKVQP